MIYIGIDTGLHTGFAVWDSKERIFLSIETLPIHKAMNEVISLRNVHEDIKVIFEDARQRKWIPKEKSISEYRGKLMGSGAIKRDAVIWEDFLTDCKIPFEMVAPSKGNTKMSPEWFKTLTGYQGRTSNHGRDAALLVFQK